MAEAARPARPAVGHLVVEVGARPGEVEHLAREEGRPGPGEEERQVQAAVVEGPVLVEAELPEREVEAAGRPVLVEVELPTREAAAPPVAAVAQDPEAGVSRQGVLEECSVQLDRIAVVRR